MTRTTTASLAYIATQVYFRPSSFSLRLTTWQLRFALSSSSVFCRTDTSTDSERFYESVLDFFDHPDEQNEVRDLLNWWNWWVLVPVVGFLRIDTLTLDSQVFPSYVSREHTITGTSALARLKEKRGRGLRPAA
jgi:hypothetical protein